MLTLEEKYLLKNQILKECFGECVSTFDFVREVFPTGFMERQTHYEDEKPNLIVSNVMEIGDRRFAKNVLVFDDLAGLSVATRSNEYTKMILMSPVLFSGRRRNKQNAFLLFGITLDIDDVETYHLNDLIHQTQTDILPLPSYICNSGTGVHLWYLLEEPVPLTPSLTKQLNDLKTAMIDQVWNDFTSGKKEREYQGVIHGYRVPGTKTKLGDEYPVAAYRCGDKHTIEYLLDYFPAEVKHKQRYHLSLDKAKEKYPEWYQRRIVEKQPPYRFTTNRRVYDWFLRMASTPGVVTVGHRYYYISSLFIFAKKCEVPKDEAMEDALKLLQSLDALSTSRYNHFTKADINDASKFYDDHSIRYTREWIARKTNIPMRSNKRYKGTQRLSRSENIKQRAIAERSRKYPDGDWFNTDGAPRKDLQVLTWQLYNRGNNKSQCARDLSMSRTTVTKWWRDLSDTKSIVKDIRGDDRLTKEQKIKLMMLVMSESRGEQQ